MKAVLSRLLLLEAGYRWLLESRVLRLGPQRELITVRITGPHGCARYITNGLWVGVTNGKNSEHGVSDGTAACGDAELSTATLARRLYALTALHRAGGFDSPADAPEVQLVWAGIKRTHRTERRQKTPTGTKLISTMVAELGDRLIDVRDRAILLLAFAGAFRRSELVALDVEDITDTEDGLRIAVRRSKADQEGAGEVVGLPTAPTQIPARFGPGVLAGRQRYHRG